MAEYEAERIVHAQIPYVFDKEIHVSTVQSPRDGRFGDIREYIPSKNFYGRGLTFPLSMLNDIRDGLGDMWEANGAGAEGTPTEGA